MRPRDIRQAAQEGVFVVDCADFDDDALEIIVVMGGFAVMVRAAIAKIVFGAGAKAKQDRGVDPPLPRGDDFDRCAARAARISAPTRAASAASTRSVLFSTMRSAQRS